MSQAKTPSLGHAWAPPAALGPVAATRRFVERFSRSTPIGMVAAISLILICLVGAFAEALSPYEPLATNFATTRQAPGMTHLLGTDHLGRDVLTRLIFGARVTLLVAITSVLIGDTLGFLWGVSSGYLGGRFDMFSQRLLEILLSFPGLILAILLMVSLGSSLSTVIIAIAISRVPLSTRVIRSVVLSIKQQAYVEAARSIGAGNTRIMLRHVAPQCIAPLLVIISANLGTAIFAEAALSFLGVGVPPPTPSWGNMLGGVLAEAFRPPWWMVIFPGLAITLTIMAANLFGDGLRDFLDPRLKGKLETRNT